MSEKQQHIRIIATGGTIDSKFHAPTEGKIIKNESGIPDYLNEIIHPHFTYKFKKVIMIDSLDMLDEHRYKIIEEINKTDTNKIIVTHGTDTMIETAKFIEDKISDIQKTIILVGSMIPLDGFYHSDAPFNIGYAIAQVQACKPGVYICMNAHCFTPQEAIKNISIARFEFKDAS